MWITSSLATVKAPTIVALGNFDGVHRGHRRVIEPILPHVLAAPSPVSPQRATSEQSPTPSLSAEVLSSKSPQVERLATEAAFPAHATVVTFYPHPQEFFTGQPRALLTPLEEKVQYLRAIGVEQLVLLPFDHALANLTPQQFVDIILVQHLQARRVSVGQDFCFGRQRSGTTADLEAIAALHGIAVQVVPLQTSDGERISSSAIRQALQQGDLPQANQLLGRPYNLVGQVTQGQQLGRTLGFPTANLKLPPEKFLPKQGVYCVWVHGSTLPEQPLPGVMNMGCRPTVDGIKQTVEVHLLDWTGDLYGQTLTVSLERFLRPEQKFDSLDALKAQIQADCTLARSLLAVSPHA